MLFEYLTYIIIDIFSLKMKPIVLLKILLIKYIGQKVENFNFNLQAKLIPQSRSIKASVQQIFLA